MAREGEPLDHHFVPQFYLRAFRDTAVPEGQEPWLWVGDLGERSVERRAPKNVGKKANYYSFPDVDAKSPETLEEILSKVESEAAPVIKRLISGDLRFLEQDRANVLFFMAFFVGRTPFFCRMIEGPMAEIGKEVMLMSARQPDYFERTLREAQAQTGVEFTPEEVEDLRQWAANDSNYTVTLNPVVSLWTGIEMSLDTIFPVFEQMKWAVLRAAGNGGFLTCDNPVSWFNPRPRPPFNAGRGLAMRNVEVTFPIAPNLALLGTWEGPVGVLDARDRIVEELNRRRAVFAERHVFADRESLVRAALAFRQQIDSDGDQS
jgi:hypothetical protein